MSGGTSRTKGQNGQRAMKKGGSLKKGRRGQADAAELWVMAGWKEAYSTGSGQSSRLGGQRMADLAMTDPYWVEVKVYSVITDKMKRDWWVQVVSECKKPYQPILMYRVSSKKNHGKWYVRTMDHQEIDISWESFVDEIKKERRKRSPRTPKRGALQSV